MDELFLSIHQVALKAKGGISGLSRRLGKRQQTLINKLNEKGKVDVETRYTPSP